MSAEERPEQLENKPARTKRRSRWLLAGVGLVLGVWIIWWAFGPETAKTQPTRILECSRNYRLANRDGDTKTNEQIKDAIQNKSMIEFDYNGYHRIVEPHVYGMRGGVEQLLVYQVEGGSSSGGLPAWRFVRVLRMSGLRILDRTFPGQRPTPSGKHSQWDTIHIIVQ